MRLLVLDGANSIGGTKLYLEDGATGILVDFGINYGRWGLFFEEYLQPRPTRGLYDLWTLGLVPKVDGIYRRDLLPQGFQPSCDHALRVAAVLISHPHLDHCGLAGVLRADVPFYASAVGTAIMKAMQDTGKPGFYGEFAYLSPRVPNVVRPESLEAGRHAPYDGRRAFTIAGGVSDTLRDFWQASPAVKKPLSAQPIEAASDHIGDLKIRAFPVDHSIPGSMALIFDTEFGPVVYTGDLRLHGKQREETLRFVEVAARERPYLLIVEGTRLGREATPNGTEQQVLESALAAARAARKLIIADFGPRHVERLETFLIVARETGRRLLVLAKDAYLLEAIASADASTQALLNDATLGVFDELRLKPHGWERRLRQRLQRRFIAPGQVLRDPGAYILAFSLYDMNDYLDLAAAEGATYIYSSTEAHGEDQRMDMWRLWNWTQHCGMAVHGFRWVGVDEHGNAEFSGTLHASGHISAEDLLWLLKEIKPQFVLPIHTQHREWFAESLRGEPTTVVLTQNGCWFEPN
jgi:ribonuclease J